MGDGFIGKFVYFWIFIMGGLIVSKFLGIADTAKNMILLTAALALVFIVWNVMKARHQRDAAAKKPQSTPKGGNKHKKKKKKR